MLYKIVYSGHKFAVVEKHTHNHCQTFGLPCDKLNKVRNLADQLNTLKSDKTHLGVIRKCTDKIKYAEMLAMRHDGRRTWLSEFELHAGYAKWEIARIFD